MSQGLLTVKTAYWNFIPRMATHFFHVNNQKNQVKIGRKLNTS